MALNTAYQVLNGAWLTCGRGESSRSRAPRAAQRALSVIAGALSALLGAGCADIIGADFDGEARNRRPEIIDAGPLDVVENFKSSPLALRASDPEGGPVSFELLLDQPERERAQLTGGILVYDATNFGWSEARSRTEVRYVVRDLEGREAEEPGIVTVNVLPYTVEYKPPSPIEGAKVGTDLDIDGDWAAVGGEKGSAYVLRRAANGSWLHHQTVLPPEGVPLQALFGWSVALSGDWLLIGAPGNWGDANDDSPGHAYFYKREGSGAQFVFKQPLAVEPSKGRDLFGWDVSLDGELAIVSAHEHQVSNRVYPYHLQGDVWIQESALYATASSSFGWDAALDGNLLVIGAKFDSNDKGALAGCVYVLERAGSGWKHVQRLYPGGNDLSFGYMGTAVAVSDGVILAGAPGRPAERKLDGTWTVADPGRVYLFQHPEKRWQEDPVVLQPMPTTKNLGWSVALDGMLAAVGAIDSSDTGNNQGEVWLYAPELGIWQAQPYARRSTNVTDLFSSAVAVEGRTLGVGAAYATGTPVYFYNLPAPGLE